MSGEYSDEEKEKILDKVYKWGRKFSKSEYFKALTDEQRQESEFVIESFADYMYSYLGVGPQEWNEEDVEECCLSILPRKITAQESYFRSVAPVLSSFFSFLAKKNLLGSGSKLAGKMKEIDKEIVENASDPKNWGMAKSFTRAAMQAGFDITDEEEMKKFMALYNLSLEKSQDKPYVSEPRVGRNDPCPCGSGKKYKHCCGR